MMPGTAVITIAIFAAGLLVTFLKYISSLDKNMTALATRFDERTTSMAAHLNKIDKTLDKIANVDIRLAILEEKSASHEGRLRNLEAD